MNCQLAFLTADFSVIFGVLPLPRLRVSAPRNTTFQYYSCLYNGKFTVTTFKSRFSRCFELSRIFHESRQYPQNGGFWRSWETLIDVFNQLTKRSINHIRHLLIKILFYHWYKWNLSIQCISKNMKKDQKTQWLKFAHNPVWK